MNFAGLRREMKSISVPCPAAGTRLVDQVLHENQAPSPSCFLLGMGGEWRVSEMARRTQSRTSQRCSVAPSLRDSFLVCPFVFFHASSCHTAHCPSVLVPTPQLRCKHVSTTLTSSHSFPYKGPCGRRNPNQPIKTSLTLSRNEKVRNKHQTSTADGRI